MPIEEITFLLKQSTFGLVKTLK
uniref:Uncharacterized protein n=1 Tax=Lepeophtheirus salmonis TaxID=72036 RepID=A0A0K2TQT2_LEPSM